MRLFCIVLLLLTFQRSNEAAEQLRPPANDESLEFWLQNMVWHHRYSSNEIQQVTGLSSEQLTEKLKLLGIAESTRPPRPTDKVFILPYPGGRHPRIGFLDGAVEPQRETKLSVFCPWDDSSYAVMDVPEAIWSNLGLTYLAHTHIDTVWDKQGIKLAQQEWVIEPNRNLVMERTLPNGILFGTKVIPMKDHVRMKMWLTNGTDQTLSDLRVQNCVMLKGMLGFDQQSNENKIFQDGYAIAKSQDEKRWIISAWDPVNRAWGNAQCPCLHSDPKFEDCKPGETRFLRGWFSFYEGDNIKAELERIEATGWRKHPVHHVTGNVTGTVRDQLTGKLLPARLYVQNIETGEFHFAQSTATDGSAVTYNKRVGNTPSIERHTTLSADPFQLTLPIGRYLIRAERGKEYIPGETLFEVTAAAAVSQAELDTPRGLLSTSIADRINIDLNLKRFVNMNERGWFSGDTHVHRTMEDLPNLVMAEDLNVALPLNYWVRDSKEIPATSGPPLEARLIEVDQTHVIYPVNTEYEIFSVNRKRHTQGAVFVLNHKEPLNLPAPPGRPLAEEARRQGALLDLDKHSWNWSLMIVPVLGVDLFELSNNHNWRTEFGFPQWTLENAPDWPEIERTEAGFTESGWTEFGMQTYYGLLNCGFRMRVTGGTGAGVHPVPLGHGRVYVHTGKVFSYEEWISNLNAGHSFVTTGPLMDIRFNEELPGATFESSGQPKKIQITGTVESRHPLKSIQLIQNGRIVATMPVPKQQTAGEAFTVPIEIKVMVEGSGWLAVRCFEDLPNARVSFAHSNPVFIDDSARPLLPRRREVEFFVKRMDQEISRNTGILDDESLEEYRRARAIYADMLSGAAD